MRLPTPYAVLPILLLIAACGRQEPEESVEDAFEQRAAEIENRAEWLERQADNAVGAEEARLDQQAEALRNQADQVRDSGEEKAGASEEGGN